MTSVLIVAGENSGEKYGADFIRAYHQLDPTASFFGIGGQEMAEAGTEIIFPVQQLNIIGIGEAVLRYPEIKKMMRCLLQEVTQRQPQAAVLIDSPDFNLRLAKHLHQAGVPVLYYISPTIWAWRRYRLRTIKRYVSRMLLIFPFEVGIYAAHKIPATYVGHPLRERVKVRLSREDFRQKYHLPLDQTLITLLPGSRPAELRYHLPILIKSMDMIRNRIKALFLLLKAETVDRELLAKHLPLRQPFFLLEQDKYEAMTASDLILSACCTANLEACLVGTPFIAFYKISPVFYHLGKSLVKIRHYSIVNILAQRQVVPELIQTKFTPENLSQEALSLLSSAEKRSAMQRAFNQIRHLLGEEKASAKAAAELRKLIQSQKGFPSR